MKESTAGQNMGNAKGPSSMALHLRFGFGDNCVLQLIGKIFYYFKFFP